MAKTRIRGGEIRDIIKQAGGYMHVAVACGVSEIAVRHWAMYNSVPERYWAAFLKFENVDVTLEQLHAINERARKEGKV